MANGLTMLSPAGLRFWLWAGFDFKSLKYNYSHAETGLPDEFGNFEYESDHPSDQGVIYYRGQCFSSTTRGEDNGVRFAPASEVLKHPKRWSYIEVEVNEKRLELVRKWMVSQQDKLYDYAGIIGFFTPWNTHHARKWYCSEICASAAFKLFMLDKLYRRISPRRLAKVLAEKYGEPTPLLPTGRGTD
jgi:hypothetical protein